MPFDVCEGTCRRTCVSVAPAPFVGQEIRVDIITQNPVLNAEFSGFLTSGGAYTTKSGPRFRDNLRHVLLLSIDRYTYLLHINV